MYISRTQKYSTSQEAIGLIYSWMEAAGWELWDTVSATNKIYRSNGESGERLHGYVRVYLTGNYIRKRGYRFWANAAHQGHDEGDPASDPTTNTALCASGQSLFFYGSKDIVYFATSYANLNARQNPLFGHVVPLDGFYGTLAAGASSGENVTVTITEDIMDRFCVGHVYNLSPVADGIYQFARCVAIDKTARTLVLDKLTKSHAQGSYIGWAYRTFFVNVQIAGRAHQLDVIADKLYQHPTSTTMNTLMYNYFELKDTLYQFATAHDYADQVKSPLIGKVSGSPIAVIRTFYGMDGKQTKIAHGFMGSADVGCAAYGLPQDVFVVAGSDEGPDTVRSVSSATATTLADDPAVKNWPVDSLVGKYVIIVGGPGINQTRRVSANTGNEVSIATAWDTTPTTASQYRLASGVFRMVRLENASSPSDDVRPLFRESF